MQEDYPLKTLKGKDLVVADGRKSSGGCMGQNQNFLVEKDENKKHGSYLLNHTSSSLKFNLSIE